MSAGKISAARVKVYAPPAGAKADTQVHVYVFDVFHQVFLEDHKAFENTERAVQHQRSVQERIYLEQEAEPELFDIPFLSSDPALLEHVAKDAEFARITKRDLTGDARARNRRR